MLINFTFLMIHLYTQLNTHEYVVNYIQGNSYQKLLIISESYYTENIKESQLVLLMIFFTDKWHFFLQVHLSINHTQKCQTA